MKTCPQCSGQFEVCPEDQNFYDRISPVISGKKYLIPEPKLCPTCRRQRRLSWRNERNLYKRKCDLSGKQIISMYRSDVPFPVFGTNDWHGNGWDPLEYGREFDFSRPFFEQFHELSQVVPRINFMNQLSENSEYANYAYSNKNCYLIFGSHYNEDCLYCHYNWKSVNCMDCIEVLESELIYEGIYSEKCYNCRFIEYCFNCSDCDFCFDLIGCKNCLFCSNLQNKEYHIHNEPYSQEEFVRKKAEILSKPRTGLSAEFTKLKMNAIHRHVFQRQCENCIGSDLQHCRNIRFGFHCKYSEDVAYGDTSITKLKDAMDCTNIGYDPSEMLYECIGNSGNQFALFTNACWHNADILYCEQCLDSHDLFGCIGLKHKEYCIFNKQYGKQEYEKLVPQIIEHMMKNGEWGEFFPMKFSTFGYNESVAQLHFPLTKAEVEKRGWAWKEKEPPDFSGVTKRIPGEKLPDQIADIPDDILNWAIICEVSKEPFKIQKAELEFYRKMNLPVPRLHPEVRSQMRLKVRNPEQLWGRNCSKCGEQIQSSYQPERIEKVYCEKCYLDTVH